jgi:dUTP pyrophosphatase
MKTLKIKLLSNKAKLPTKAYPSDAGADMYAASIEYNLLNNQITYFTDIAVKVPEGYWLLLAPRSSVSNTGLRLSNSLGVLDENFIGNISFKFDILKEHGSRYNIGDRIGQMILMKKENYSYELVQELEITDRGSGGFGSTGK